MPDEQAKIKLVTQVQIDCPCGGNVLFATAPGGEVEPCAIHTIPFCDQFLNMDLVDYAEWVRKKLEEEHGDSQE